MDSDAFRQHGYALIDWLADYYQRVESLPVLAQTEPGAIRAQLPPQAPLKGEAFEQIMADVERIILPGITHWQSPNFFAFFPANSSPPAILGELLSAGLGVQGMLWATSPACTELETHVLDWVVELMGLPQRFRSDSDGGGVLQDSASSAVLCALLAARERATAGVANRQGGRHGLIAYASNQAHSSIEKAVGIAGIGRDNVRLIASDDQQAMNPEALAQQIQADRAAGLQPFWVNATLGTTSSLAFDPLSAIARICQEQQLWLHVDAAMAGNAAVCPEFRHWQQGLDQADSYCFNPHKWLLTNFDCSCLYVADRQALINALSILPEYLRNQASTSGEVIDYRDWQIPLGRRFRALKLWFVIRHYGVNGLQHHIRHHVELAQHFAHWIEADPDFELAAAVSLNLVCFRHRQSDTFNQTLLERVNASGSLYLTHTRLNGLYTLRLCIGQPHTTLRHVTAAWHTLKTTAEQLSHNDR